MNVIMRNLPGHSEWESSFYGQLSEYRHWNNGYYEELKSELESLCKDLVSDSHVTKELAYSVLFLQQKIMMIFQCHYDPMDSVHIQGVETETIRELDEELQALFRSLFVSD